MVKDIFGKGNSYLFNSAHAFDQHFQSESFLIDHDEQQGR
jgi:hypothetical protein